MANITGESAEKVSSQLTAIWNNFDDSTKSLESYADALAYLGAKTAADTNQIATATEKFAASAKVVGLSYEYASAAVAEVIDRT
jgi:TP901 family phage tail tape measure protein